MKNLISLFYYTGTWCKPYKQAGWKVLQIDIKYGIDILNIDSQLIYKLLNVKKIHGVLAAPPCTDFAVSGAQYWKTKDENGTTEYSIKLVKKTLHIIKQLDPEFYCIENPVGRINKLIPQLGNPQYFQPYYYGDPYTKKTGLYGKFVFPKPSNIVIPIRTTKQGSWIQKLGGKSERTKELRSITPEGFAKQFYLNNN